MLVTSCATKCRHATNRHRRMNLTSCLHIIFPPAKTATILCHLAQRRSCSSRLSFPASCLSQSALCLFTTIAASSDPSPYRVVDILRTAIFTPGLARQAWFRLGRPPKKNPPIAPLSTRPRDTRQSTSKLSKLSEGEPCLQDSPFGTRDTIAYLGRLDSLARHLLSRRTPIDAYPLATTVLAIAIATATARCCNTNTLNCLGRRAASASIHEQQGLVTTATATAAAAHLTSGACSSKLLIRLAAGCR